MKVVSETGELQTRRLDIGCSHSGYERVNWDQGQKFIPVCKNDVPTGGKSGQDRASRPNTDDHRSGRPLTTPISATC